jgi:hypothetical protein
MYDFVSTEPNTLRPHAPLCRLLKKGRVVVEKLQVCEIPTSIKRREGHDCLREDPLLGKAEQQAQEIRDSWDPVKKRLRELEGLKQARELGEVTITPMLWNGGSRPSKRTATRTTSIRIASIGLPLNISEPGRRKPTVPSRSDYAGRPRPLEEPMFPQKLLIYLLLYMRTKSFAASLRSEKLRSSKHNSRNVCGILGWGRPANSTLTRNRSNESPSKNRPMPTSSALLQSRSDAASVSGYISRDSRTPGSSYSSVLTTSTRSTTRFHVTLDCSRTRSGNRSISHSGPTRDVVRTRGKGLSLRPPHRSQP